MNWKTIRLELARTRDFPDGSVGRAYLLRLPLDSEGRIDAAAVQQDPARATVRRFWTSEPDMIGYVVHTPRGWAFSYEPGDEDDEPIFHLESHALRLGEYITVTEPDGRKLPFRIASLRELN
ncbi:MAG: hypothetical protein ACT4N8_02005 [Sphingosinicella sp.]|uniref:hypothetical protein n=1 Tax=Sphingosinicella sp. TaxID=1917971 RepID=UPI004037F17B